MTIFVGIIFFAVIFGLTQLVCRYLYNMGRQQHKKEIVRGINIIIKGLVDDCENYDEKNMTKEVYLILHTPSVLLLSGIVKIIEEED